jgi:hypothetical protein
MNSADSKSPLGSEFDNFLFTPLGEDENGLPVSVVSLLARINLDPWQEAGELAALPPEAAAKRLAGSLDTLMDPVLRRANTETMVLRLLALLPRSVSAAARTPIAELGSAATPDPGTRIGVILIITSAVVLLVSQFIAAHRETPIQPQVVHRLAPLVAPSQTTPQKPGR